MLIGSKSPESKNHQSPLIFLTTKQCSSTPLSGPVSPVKKASYLGKS